MKKIFVSGMLAVCLIALSQQQASAWIHNRLSLGLNWDYSSGGNSFGWGAYRNGQPPAPDMAFSPPPVIQQAPPVFVPAAAPVIQQAPPVVVPAGPPVIVPAPHGPAAPPSFTPMPQPHAYAPLPQPYYGSPYQFANYPRVPYYYQGTWYSGR